MRLFYSREVAAARRAHRPLVALETSVLAQGLPYPQNLSAARQCEAAIRSGGAVPAAIAILDGRAHAGLDASQIERLALGPGSWKIGSRDISVAIAKRATGGTTVSATCELAAAAGILVFSTGGLGGVHRGASEHFDVSQDLGALARFPVAVVCAGAKSVLDLPKTLELLESLAVPVIGVGTAEFPGFYTRSTGIFLEHSVENAAEAAEIVRARRALGQGGAVFAVPPPACTELKFEEVERHLRAALREAVAQRVEGKSVTPFLLGEMARRTSGRSLAANLALLENNARFAGALAVALAGEGRRRR
jgi:pseudouridine-5'-phosphate glycosidase